MITVTEYFDAIQALTFGVSYTDMNERVYKARPEWFNYNDPTTRAYKAGEVCHAEYIIRDEAGEPLQKIKVKYMAKADLVAGTSVTDHKSWRAFHNYNEPSVWIKGMFALKDDICYHEGKTYQASRYMLDALTEPIYESSGWVELEEPEVAEDVV